MNMGTNENSLILAMTKVGNKLKGSKLMSSNLRGIKSNLGIIQKSLELDETESLIFVTTFIVQMQEQSMGLRDFTRFLEINPIDAIRYNTEFETLIQKKYITSTSRSGSHNVTFMSGRRDLKVNTKLMESILGNKPINLNLKKELDKYKFFEKVSKLIDQRDNDDMVSDELFDLVKDLEGENPQLPFIKDLCLMNIETEDRTLIYEMADDLVRGVATSLTRTLCDIYDDVRDRMSKTRDLVGETTILNSLKLISLSEVKFHNDATLELTDKSKEILLGEDQKLFVSEESIRNMIKSTDVQSKVLFFDNDTRQQLDMLSSSLEQKNFTELQSRLKENNLPSGVAIVFYGSPGTGKSESAYQLAKKTGRDIITVDLSNTKSMWFGQSEKKIKEIFTDYNKVCQYSEIKPILLFNEADGVLSKRMDNRNSATHQTENTIQNILLEEFEKNQGIIIATTNLEKNLDSAFERRFLFKVKYDKPSTQVRKLIWRNKMPWIDDDVLSQIVERFDFSGGEIDNVFRKMVMHEVTTGSSHDPSLLMQFCESERFENQRSKRKLGYL